MAPPTAEHVTTATDRIFAQKRVTSPTTKHVPRCH
jgi:hypothetical protein